MTTNLILAAIIAVVGALGFLGLWMKGGQDQTTGASLEAGKVTAATAKTETAIAQAEVDAPKSVAGVEARLNKGTF